MTAGFTMFPEGIPHLSLAKKLPPALMAASSSEEASH